MNISKLGAKNISLEKKFMLAKETFCLTATRIVRNEKSELVYSLKVLRTMTHNYEVYEKWLPVATYVGWKRIKALLEHARDNDH